MDKYKRKLIAHKRQKRDRLVDFLIYLAAGMTTVVGVILVILLYRRMAGPLW